MNGFVVGLSRGSRSRRRHLPRTRFGRRSILRRNYDHPVGEPEQQRRPSNGQTPSSLSLWGHCVGPRSRLQEVPRRRPPDVDASITSASGQGMSLRFSITVCYAPIDNFVE